MSPSRFIPTVMDVAREAGVSHMTVSRVFGGKNSVATPTRDRVLAVARRLGYRPNHVARSLAQACTRTLGLVINPNLWFADVLVGAEETAQQRGYSLIYSTPRLAPAAERERIDVLRDRRVDGLLMVSGSDVREHAHLNALHADGVPLVTINRYCDDRGFPRIFFDYGGAARSVVHRLLGAGHRRVGFVGGAPDHAQESVRERIDGYRAGLRDGARWKPDAEAFGGQEPEEGVVLTEQVFRRCPEVTALLVVNDHTAAGVLRALRRLSRRVPEDVAVVSLHDTQIARCTDPPLSSVRHSTHEAGRLGCSMLISQIEEPTEGPGPTRLLRSALVMRQSCGLNPSAGEEKICPLD